MVVKCLDGSTNLNAIIDQIILDYKEIISQLLNTRVNSIRRCKNIAKHGLQALEHDQIYPINCNES